MELVQQQEQTSGHEQNMWSWFYNRNIPLVMDRNNGVGSTTGTEFWTWTETMELVQQQEQSSGHEQKIWIYYTQGTNMDFAIWVSRYLV